LLTDIGSTLTRYKYLTNKKGRRWQYGVKPRTFPRCKGVFMQSLPMGNGNSKFLENNNDKNNNGVPDDSCDEY